MRFLKDLCHRNFLNFFEKKCLVSNNHLPRPAQASSGQPKPAQPSPAQPRPAQASPSQPNLVHHIINKFKLVWKKWCNSKLVSIMSIWNKLKLAINQLNFLNFYKLVWACSSPKKHLSSSFGFVLNLVFYLFCLVTRITSNSFWFRYKLSGLLFLITVEQSFSKQSRQKL